MKMRTYQLNESRDRGTANVDGLLAFTPSTLYCAIQAKISRNNIKKQLVFCISEAESCESNPIIGSLCPVLGEPMC